MDNRLFFRKYNADSLTPVVAYSMIQSHFKKSILCESVEKAAGRGRYSIIACNPDAIWEYTNGCDATITYYDELCHSVSSQMSQSPQSPLALLKDLYAKTRCTIDDGLPSAVAGLFGYFSYDAIRLVEKIPEPLSDMLGIPDGYLMRPRIVLVFDSVYDDLLIVTNNFDGCSDSDTIEKRFDLIETLLSQKIPLSIKQLTPSSHAKNDTMRYHQSKESFLDSVAKAQEYIAAGDAFQIVLSQRFSKPFHADYFDFYRALRRINPSPYMFYCDHGDFALAGASPEILVRNDNGTITIRPIAGTRPRGKTKEQDMQLETELLNDEKEVAEHLMLLDLGRNDVGRISEFGTVVVTDEYLVERYSHVMHIVSNVTGKLKKGYDFIDAFFSALPAGTVSGAPKIRAMQIINELELEKRSFYAGGIGYFSANGNGDFSIMLRTALLKDNMIYFQAGAGIVADSDPHSEYIETITKATAIIKATEMVG